MTKRKAGELAMLATQSQLADDDDNSNDSPDLAHPLDSPPAKRARTVSTDDSLSPLTDLSDLEDNPLYPAANSQSQPPTRNNSTRKRKAQEDSNKSSPKRQKKQAQSNTPTASAKRQRVPEPVTPAQASVQWKWNLTTLASRKYIFVRLNEHGRPADDKDSSEPQSYWWPAKVSETNTGCVTVDLYGDDRKGARRKLSFKAGEANTIPYSPIPFTKQTFATPPSLASSLAKSWGYACKALNRDEYGACPSDDMPDIATPAPLPLPLPFLPTASPVTSAKSNKRLKIPRSWSPPPADPAIMIPGERVLSRTPRTDQSTTYYYPAMVQKYITPSKASQPARYELEFFNGDVHTVERSFFYLRHEHAYNTCRLGPFGTSGLNDDDSDSEEFVTRQARPPSPPPVLPPLPLPTDNGKTYSALPLPVQFALVTPVLERVLSNTYAPAQERNNSFMVGRKARQTLQQTAGLRGGLTQKELSQFRTRLISWALGDERWARRLDDNGEPIDDHTTMDAFAASPVSEDVAVQDTVPATTPSLPDVSLPALTSSPRNHPALSADAESVIGATADVAASSVGGSDLRDCNTLELSLECPHACDPHDKPPVLLDHASDFMSSSAPDRQPLEEDVANEVAEAKDITVFDSETAGISKLASPLGIDSVTSPAEVVMNSPDPPRPGAGSEAPPADSNGLQTDITHVTQPEDSFVPFKRSNSESLQDVVHPAKEVLTSHSSLDDENHATVTSSPSAFMHASGLAVEANPSALLPASSAISPPSFQALVAASSPASRTDEVSPSSTLPAAYSSPIDPKNHSQAGSPNSNSGAETRVDERSFSFSHGAHRRRRTGYDRYEALSRSERNQYCLDVLMYEAVIQIHLWRGGKKTSVEQTVDDDAETAMHAECLRYANELEQNQLKWIWMDDLPARRRLEDKKKPQPKARETFSGKSLRPAAKQISYQE